MPPWRREPGSRYWWKMRRRFAKRISLTMRNVTTREVMGGAIL